MLRLADLVEAPARGEAAKAAASEPESESDKENTEDDIESVYTRQSLYSMFKYQYSDQPNEADIIANAAVNRERLLSTTVEDMAADGPSQSHCINIKPCLNKMRRTEYESQDKEDKLYRLFRNRVLTYAAL